MRKNYLDFNGTDDYLKHLKDNNMSKTKLDIEVETTKTGSHGIFYVMWFAVATCRFEDYVARDRSLIKRMANFEMQGDDYKAQETKSEPAYRLDAKERLEKCKQWFVDRGIQVEPGIWK